MYFEPPRLPADYSQAACEACSDQSGDPDQPGDTVEDHRDGHLELSYLKPVLDVFAAAGPSDAHRVALREQLLTGFLPVAKSLARRYSGRGEPLEDLEQVAAIGLLKAIDRFDPRLGHHFLAFAVPTITGDIRRHFRDSSWAVGVPRRLKELHVAIPIAASELSDRLRRAPRPSEIAAHLYATTADVIDALHAGRVYRPRSLDVTLAPDRDADTVGDGLGRPDPGFELFIDSHTLAPHLESLPSRERSILIMRFYKDMTQTQIAELIGISQMHVSRLLSATLRKLRDAVDNPAPDNAGRPISGDGMTF